MADKLPVFAAIDVAPSEQLGDLEQMHTFALVYAPSEEHMTECVNAMYRTANNKNFAIGQYRSKEKTRSYAKAVLASLENEECRKWLRVFLISHRAREIVAGEAVMLRTLQLQDWCRVSGDRKWLSHLAGTDGSGAPFGANGFAYGQGIMVVWMAFVLRLVWKLLDQEAKASHRWHIVSDQIAGDDVNVHPKALMFSGCLTWFDSDFTMQCAYHGKDTMADLADTFAGIGKDCLENIGHPEWDAIRTTYLRNACLNWSFYKNPPWPDPQAAAQAV